MNKKVAATALFSAVMMSGAQAASFDCAKAKGYIETSVCTNPQLSQLDDQLQQVYSAQYKAAAPEQQTALRNAQRSWLKSSRNQATSESALIEAYQQRIHQLSAGVTANSPAPVTSPQPAAAETKQAAPQQPAPVPVQPAAPAVDGFYQQIVAFAATPEAEKIAVGLSSEERLQAANGVVADLQKFIANRRDNYTITLKQYEAGTLFSLYKQRQDYDAAWHFLAQDIVAGGKTSVKNMNTLGVNYLYGEQGLPADDKKARLLLAFTASKGLHYARYVIANDYLFRNAAASKEQLQSIQQLMAGLPWFTEYNTLKENTAFRLAHYDGYALKLNCVANTTVKTPLNIKQCIEPYTVLLTSNDPTVRKTFALAATGAPVWRDDYGTSVMYTPAHFNFNVSNGKNNTLLTVEVYRAGASQPEQRYQAESYQPIAFTR